jgi:hypothetical protein
MKLRFNKNYFIVFIILFLTEVAIAVFLKDGFVRHTFGDFLVVILLYCFFKSLLEVNVLGIAMVTLLIAFLTEFLQMTNFLDILGLKHNRLANIVFGNSFSMQDLAAYKLGIVLVLTVEMKNIRSSK